MTNLRLVFLRPRNADNLGSIARAMANFGLRDWVLVNPNPLLLASPRARQLAVHSEEWLERVSVVDSLAEAVSDCHWVVGTSMRGALGVPSFSPRDFASTAWKKNAHVALVFGDERSGLTNEDLQHCHAVTRLPSLQDQPSLNLAQAAMLYCYEFRMAQGDSLELSSAPKARRADEKAFGALEANLRHLLSQSGFLRPNMSTQVLHRLAVPWKRSDLTAKEAALWNAVLRSLSKGLK